MKVTVIELVLGRTFLWFFLKDAPDIRPDNPAFFKSGTGLLPDTGLHCWISG
jgi:hypothetical protein